MHIMASCIVFAQKLWTLVCASSIYDTEHKYAHYGLLGLILKCGKPRTGYVHVSEIVLTIDTSVVLNHVVAGVSLIAFPMHPF